MFKKRGKIIHYNLIFSNSVWVEVILNVTESEFICTLQHCPIQDCDVYIITKRAQLRPDTIYLMIEPQSWRMRI